MALADVPAVYVIGAPRSGTTWVQLMLGSHPEVATPVELSFFSDFAAPWYGAWDRACAGGAGQIKPAHWGLPAALTEEEFEQALKDVVERVYRSLLAAKPGARTVVEKDPQYCMCVGAIVRTVPRARFIHVLRDGRDVVCSTVRVSESWGSVWAPGRVSGAAGLWRLFTQSALRARSAPGGYMEIRYEDLLGSSGPDVLREALTFCGIDDDPVVAGELFERYSYPAHSKSEVLSGGLVWTGEAVRAGADTSFPDDFIGQAAAGIWESELGREDRQEFDSVAGELLVELGYEDDRSWAGAGERPRRRWSPLPTRR